MENLIIPSIVSLLIFLLIVLVLSLIFHKFSAGGLVFGLLFLAIMLFPTDSMLKNLLLTWVLGLFGCLSGGFVYFLLCAKGSTKY